jgi:hypothetical protein
MYAGTPRVLSTTPARATAKESSAKPWLSTFSVLWLSLAWSMIEGESCCDDFAARSIANSNSESSASLKQLNR